MPDTTTELATTAMLPEQLNQIMNRHAAAEKGWSLERDSENPFHLIIEGDGPTVIAHLGSTDTGVESYPVEENAEFAVHAYWDVPVLVGEVRRLQAALNHGANTTDPVAVLRLGLEQTRLTLEHNTRRCAEIEKKWNAVQGAYDFLERSAMPELRREVEFQKEGKVRWRDRAVAAEQLVARLTAERDKAVEALDTLAGDLDKLNAEPVIV